jgi:hypothetical protein
MRQASIRWRSKAVADLQLKLVSVGILQNAKISPRRASNPHCPHWRPIKLVDAPDVSSGGVEWPASAAWRNAVANLFYGVLRSGPHFIRDRKEEFSYFDLGPE